MTSIEKSEVVGFTLLELLITLGLFAAIMSILMNTYFQFHKQNERLESILQLRQEARILEQILREDLKSVVYLDEFMKDPRGEKDGRKSGLVGIDNSSGDKDRDSLNMHVNHPNRFLRGLPLDRDPEIHEVGYFLEETESGSLRLKRREEYYIDTDITDGEESIVHTLSENVVSLDIKYYRGIDLEALDEWNNSNTIDSDNQNNKSDKIPAGVKITLEFSSQTGETLKSIFQFNMHPKMGSFIDWK